MAKPGLQRVYRAPCPGCGAPVDFLSAQSTCAICPYCQTTVVRQGEALLRIGKMADVFSDFSPLELGVTGRWNQKPFTLVGRLQYRYGDTTWNEWQACFDDGTMAALAEDNGAFVFTRPVTAQAQVAGPEYLRVGATTVVNGKHYTVTFNQPVQLVSAQGELGHLPTLGVPFSMAELRSEDAEVLSIDYGLETPVLSAGRSVALDDLKLHGLKDGSVRSDSGRSFDCPHCGAPLQVRLDFTKTIVCRTCHSIISLDQGVGGELRHVQQDEPVQPLIPLGSTGSLQGAEWQVVGFQHRSGQATGGDDEWFGWSEYLLFHAKRGFIFLVDAEDGWSVVKPATGVPSQSPDRSSATYLGTRYTLRYDYKARTDYVVGEFYWPVVRGQTSDNRDYAHQRNRLSMEQTGAEVVWSNGVQLMGNTVAIAFGQVSKMSLFNRGDAAPVSTSIAGSGLGVTTTATIIILALVLAFLLLPVLMGRSRCDPNVETCSSSGYRTSGGSWGGFSTGGGHK